MVARVVTMLCYVCSCLLDSFDQILGGIWMMNDWMDLNRVGGGN